VLDDVVLVILAARAIMLEDALDDRIVRTHSEEVFFRPGCHGLPQVGSIFPSSEPDLTTLPCGAARGSWLGGSSRTLPRPGGAMKSGLSGRYRTAL